jgi:hypothetical protein
MEINDRALLLCFLFPTKKDIIMRYVVKAVLKKNKHHQLKKAIDSGRLGKGSIAGGEYIRDMKFARLSDDGTTEWIEVCFCDPPLDEERSYWEEYFELKEIADATDRKNCKHETGESLWSCVNCNCTKKQEAELMKKGRSFYESLLSL